MFVMKMLLWNYKRMLSCNRFFFSRLDRGNISFDELNLKITVKTFNS